MDNFGSMGSLLIGNIPLILAERIKKCLSTSFNQQYVRKRLIECFGWENAIDKYIDLYYN